MIPDGAPLRLTPCSLEAHCSQPSFSLPSSLQSLFLTCKTSRRTLPQTQTCLLKDGVLMSGSKQSLQCREGQHVKGELTPWVMTNCWDRVNTRPESYRAHWFFSLGKTTSEESLQTAFHSFCLLQSQVHPSPTVRLLLTSLCSLIGKLSSGSH